MTGLNELAATELVEGYRAGRFSPVEVLSDVLAQIDRCDPVLNAIWHLDRDEAMAQARASEARWRAGAPLLVNGAVLDGVPVTIKENIATRGVPMPLGTAATDLTPRSEDAPPAARLREAGAVFVGRTTMPDLGMLSSGLSSFHRLARNPWNTAMNPGGSSAGAGVAGAAGYGPIHLGTDIGGSIRLPAAWCGLVGLKPSLGRVPIDPPFMGRVAGPMTRNVADAALAMAVLSGPDGRDHMSLPPAALDWQDLDGTLRGLRVGLLLDAGCGMPVAPEVMAAVQAAADRFREAGALVKTLDPWMTPDLLKHVDDFWRTRAAVETGGLPAERRAKILPKILEWAEAGLGRSGEAVYRDYAATIEVRRRTTEVSQRYDLILSPVSPNTAFPADWACPCENDMARTMAHIGFTMPFNLGEQPAISVPCGHDAAGVPIGLQIAGRRFDDLGVLRAARAWEAIAPAPHPWPMAQGVPA